MAAPAPLAALDGRSSIYELSGPDVGREASPAGVVPGRDLAANVTVVLRRQSAPKPGVAGPVASFNTPGRERCVGHGIGGLLERKREVLGGCSCGPADACSAARRYRLVDGVALA